MNKHPQYFEGVLQLRNPNQEIIDFVADEINKREDVWISKTEEHNTGIDLFLSSNKFLSYIGKKLKDRFSGELIKTKTLFTQDKLTSKMVFRGCILFRYYNLKKGDIIKIRQEPIKIISIGKDIFGMSMETNKKLHLKFKDLKSL